MEFLQNLLSVFYPQRCEYCGAVIEADKRLCENCQDDIPEIGEPFCILCGFSKEDCTCKKKKSAYKGIVAPYYYDGAVKKAIKRMKFSDRPQIAKTLARDLSKCIDERLPDIKFDIITCVPMSKKERRSRGFNQSELIAKELKIKGGSATDTELLQKQYDVRPQHSLSAAQRQGNVLGIFDVAPDRNIRGKTILLCDDVKTTGATLNECAGVLIAAGAANVYCACVAIAKTDAPKH